MINKFYKNLNYNIKEAVIVFSFMLLIIIAISLSGFKSSNNYKGKQLHQGGLYIGKILSSSSLSFDRNQKQEFRKLNNFIIDNNISKNGFPFIIYTSKTEEVIQYIVALPVESCKNIKLPLKFVCNYFPKQDVLTVIHEGYLFDRNKAWHILDSEISKQNKKIFNAPFEIFWKGNEQSRDSTTWITGVYYPIK